MSFKDLTTRAAARAAALLTPKPANPSKKDPQSKTPEAGSKSGKPESKKT